LVILLAKKVAVNLLSHRYVLGRFLSLAVAYGKRRGFLD